MKKILIKAFVGAGLVIVALSALMATDEQSPRKVTNIDQGWKFALVDDGQTGEWTAIGLPHTWNVEDTIDGDNTYRRGQGAYQKELTIAKKPGRRYFLRFEGANEKAWVKVNGKDAGSHRGGYTAFAFEITDLVKDGANLIEVLVDNSMDREIMPLYCDFNKYGGIYRSVHLIETGEAAIAVTDYASPGVYLTQKKVTDDSADLEFLARVSASFADGLSVRFTVTDREGKRVKTAEAAPIPAGEWLEAKVETTISNPHLWNGVADPYLYQVRTELLSSGEVVDAMDQPLGLRYFNVDGEKGFFLNGEKYRIQGVNRHQEREGKANALSREDHEEDFAIMREMGVNAVRLAHYPQADYAYSICDREGILVWAELPFIGRTGDRTGIFLDSKNFRVNLKQQLTELIRQNYNHPAIIFWGLFNELSPPGDPASLLRELNQLAHQEDPTRPTTAATHLEDPYNDVSDLICWNRYYGWYYGVPENFGPWADRQHRKHPDRKLCISEYGAGASVKQHSELDYNVLTEGEWHPENWQAVVHEKHWAMIAERPYLWGSFLWNMFDFCVVSRDEGDRPNINDKGMVTFDRQTRKDAFYFYQANWTDAPVVHITDKRFTQRRSPFIEVKVYSNLGPVEVELNGRPVKMSSEGYCIFRAQGVRLDHGVNRITARAKAPDGRVIEDSAEWRL